MAYGVHAPRHRWALGVGPPFIVREVALPHTVRHVEHQRVGEQHDIRLLDRLAAVPAVLWVEASHLVEEDHQSRGDMQPLRIRLLPWQRSRYGMRHLERALRHHVGVDAVVPLCILIGRHHAFDVRAAVGGERRARGPKVGGRAHDGEATGGEPVLVGSGLVVLPRCEGHVARDVLLKLTGVGPRGARLSTRDGRLPGEHRAGVRRRVRGRLAPRLGEPLGTVVE